MCGIFGFFDRTNDKAATSPELLYEMGSVIEYRGPDGTGTYINEDQSVALGNKRLAILDVEHGQQPFFSECGQIVVVQNGEIFNHIELSSELEAHGYYCKTSCDTEVILGLYEIFGIDSLSRLNGMFSIAIYDQRSESLYLARDRVGEKPLYYHDSEGLSLFGSEIKSILKCMPGRQINFQALDQLMAFNYVPMPMTMFEGIYHVKPGHYLKITNEVVKEYCWWDLSKIQTIDGIAEDEWIEKFNKLLDDAVRIRLRSDVDFGAFLSGGVDSSTVVGIMSRHMSDPIKTYTIGFDDPRYDESGYAAEAAELFGTNHTMEKVQPNLLSLWPMATFHCDQPHGDVSFLPTYRVAELAARDVKMVLTGDGADELFAGYDKYKQFFESYPDETLSDSLFVERFTQSLSLFDKNDRDNLFSEATKGVLFEGDVQENTISGLVKSVQHMDYINKALYIDTTLLLSGNNLVKPDRMGMALSIENRAPFLDYRVVELAFSMPGHFKLRSSETKYIYKKAVKQLIGENLAYRKKQMFTVPVGEWFKYELRSLCEDLLLSERVTSRGIFNYGFVERMFNEHVQGERNYTREIRVLMAFEYWCREFLD